MPSGKKARGRQNRAKKEATLTAARRLLWEPTILRRDNGVKNGANCEHRLAVLPRIPQAGLAVSLMNCLAKEGYFDKATIFAGDPVDLCFRSLLCIPEVLEDESERSLAIDLLLRFIRNVYLHESMKEGESWFHGCAHNELMICNVINALELLGKFSDSFVVRRRAVKMNNTVVGGNRRDTVKFVAKRFHCTCLKELHRASRKKLPKVGTCDRCGNKFRRSDLYVCTGCMLVHYCSKECQRAIWSSHKEYCGSPEMMSRDLPAEYKSKVFCPDYNLLGME